MDGKHIEQTGLTHFGIRLIKEMNRIGMIIDTSHTSDLTVWDVLKHSEAPFIFSHSNARSVYNSVRNIPDSLLKAIGRIPSELRPLVMATFAPQFVGTNATLSLVAGKSQLGARLCEETY
jgi:membrane dipeptidase